MKSHELLWLARDDLTSRGGLAEQIAVVRGTEGRYDWLRTAYVFDESGALIAREIDYPPESGIERWIERFDRDGWRIPAPCVRREVREAPDGGTILIEDIRDCAVSPQVKALTERAKFVIRTPPILESHYCPAGRLVRHIGYGDRRAWTGTTEYVRDEQGRIVEEIQRSPLQVPESAARRAILRHLNLEEPAVVVARTAYVYDEAGRVIERSHEQGGISSTVIAFRYDGRGDLQQAETRDSAEGEPRRSEYVYEYNARGDWILRKHQTAGLANVTRREIVYRN